MPIYLHPFIVSFILTTTLYGRYFYYCLHINRKGTRNLEKLSDLLKLISESLTTTEGLNKPQEALSHLSALEEWKWLDIISREMAQV